MTKYFNPPCEISAIGRRLKGTFTIEGLQAQLSLGEILVGLFFNGRHWTAPILEDQESYNHFDSTNMESSFYALDKSYIDDYVR